jgi:hypothetical protein
MSAKTPAPLALGFSVAEDADPNRPDRKDEKLSDAEEKGTTGYHIPILLTLSMNDAVAVAKKVPPLIANKKVYISKTVFADIEMIPSHTDGQQH